MVLFLAPCLGLLPFLGDFIFGKGAEFSDMAVSHYPNAIWIQRAISQLGEIPLWSPLILSGYPLDANPLSGLHYPIGWLALLFPQPFGMNLLLVVHIIGLGIGMYYLLRLEGMDHISAVFGALAVECMPKLFAHLGAGHVTLIYAVAWTPWLLIRQRSVNKGSWQVGVILGLIALADLRWAAMAGMMWLAFGFYNAVRERITFKAVWRWGVNSIATITLAFLLSAFLLLPLLEYTGVSTRMMMTAAEKLTLSLPPLQLLGLLTPPLGSAAEWVLYPGAMVIVLVIMCFGLTGVWRKGSFWMLMAMVALIYAMGSNIPGVDILTSLPGLRLIRVPPRAIFIVGFALAVVAAYTMQALITQPDLLKKMGRVNPFLLLAALVFFQIALTAIGWVMTGEFPLRFAWGAIALLGGVLLIAALRSGRISTRNFSLAVTAWLLLDLVVSNLAGLDFRSPNIVLSQGRQAADYIRMNANGERVYSPSYSIPQQTAAAMGLELADGVDPLQLIQYVRFMDGATGVPLSGYSVTLPPMVTGDPAKDNQFARPDPGRLGLLHVGYVAADYDLDVEGLVEVTRFGPTRIYKNQLVLPSAWLQDPLRPLGQGLIGEVKLTKKANSLTADVSGSGLLVFSEIYYPGWTARVDGQPREVEVAGEVMRSISLLTGGNHHVEMVYQPTSWYLGLGVSLLAWLFCGILWIGLRKKA
jgi:hypothetical protein